MQAFDRTQEAWKRHFNIDAGNSALVVRVPKSGEAPSNPLMEEAVEKDVYVYTPVDAGWITPLQESYAGLRADKKSGSCIVSHVKHNITTTILASQIQAKDAECFIDNEPITITSIDYDPRADATVLKYDRIDGAVCLPSLPDGESVVSPTPRIDLVGVLHIENGTLKGSATTDELVEGENRYFTEDRARGSISGEGDVTYDVSTGIISLTDEAALHKGRIDNPHQVTAEQVLGYIPEDAANKSTDATFAANSDTLFPSQKAVKTYADQLINAANALVYKGALDCHANPNYPASESGWMYVVSVAGKVGGVDGTAVEAGDMVLCLTDSEGGSQAVAGAAFNIIEKNIEGYVLGPTSAADGGFAAFDGVTGKLVRDSGYTPASFDAAGVAAGLMGTHEAAFAHADILHANRANLDGINQALGTGASPTFAGLTADSSTLFVDSTNHRVGIGTATPSRPLTVVSSQAEIFLMMGQYNHGLMLQDLSSMASFLGYNGTTYNDIEFRAKSGTGSQLVLKTDGTVGINTTSPSAMLHVISNAADKPVVIAQAIAGQTANMQEWKDAGGTVRSKIWPTGDAFLTPTLYTSKVQDAGSSAYASIQFGGGNKTLTINTDNTNRWRVDAEGNLYCMGTDWGLGFSDPSADGSWRMVQSGDNISVQKRESGAWVPKSQAAPSLYTITMDGTNIPVDWANGRVQKVQLLSGANTLLLPINPVAGTTYQLHLMQPVEGDAATVDMSALPIEWYYGDTAPELTATNGYTDLIVLFYDGSKYRGSYLLGSPS